MEHSISFTLLLAVFGALAPIQAVVHGIQPLSNRYEGQSMANRNGYRYNGPAHKYLPAVSAPATEAVTTTGHWQPNMLLTHQQPIYEHTFSSKPLPEKQSYNGPYSMQHYESEEQQQKQSGNSWRLEAQQQRPQQSGSAWAEQQNQQSGNAWAEQQKQQSGSAWAEQQKQQSGSAWAEQQQQKQQQQQSGSAWAQQKLQSQAQQPQQYKQQLSGNFYAKQPQLTGSAWKEQQQQLAGNPWQLEQQQHQQHQQRKQNNNNLHTFPYVSEHNKISAAPAAMDQFGASYGVSGAAQHNRILSADMRDNQLMTQSLPDRYQQQLFAEPAMKQPSYEQQLGGSPSFMQMQSNSYELPSSYHTQHVYLEQHKEQHDSQRDQNSHPEEYALHGSNYSPSDYYHDSSMIHTAHTSNPGASASASASSSPSSSFNPSQSYPLSYQPSREFQAPYY